MRTQRHDGGRPAAVVYCVCAVYLYCVGSLLAWASLPVLTGMHPTLILSGSMGPAISAGDIVMMGPPRTAAIRTGSVVMFDDPAHADRLLTHRVVGVNEDGTYRTRGDANRSADSTGVAPENIRGVGRILVPAIGVPIMWVRTQAWPLLLMWLAGSGFAMGYLRLYGRPRMLVAAWSTPMAMPSAPRSTARRPAGASRGWERPLVRHWRPRWAIPSAVLVLALAAVLLPRLTSSHASFSGATTNSGNDWTAASDFCPTAPQTLYATADARVVEGGTTALGGQTTLGVTNKSPAAKSLITFDVSGFAGCTVSTATLRLWQTASTSARTLHVYAVASPWDEATVVWGTQPATTGGASSASSGAAGTWVSVGITNKIIAMRNGTAHGIVVQDSATNGGAGTTQTFSSREAATGRPELVVQFSANPPPAAPSGLSANAVSSTRIGLTWTDTSGGVAAFRVERSPGGAGTWAIVDSLPAGTTSYTNTGLDPSTSYDYRVRATSSSGVSEPSNVASATTPAAPAPPAAPTMLTATATGVDTVGLSWTDQATDEDGFDVQRSPAGAGTWTNAGSVGADVTTFPDTGLTAGTSYDYRVRAFNGGGASAWTDVATTTTDGCASAPAQTLVSIGDSLVLQPAPTTNYGSDNVNFGVRSLATSNGRSLVRFDAPTLTGGCAVTGATLRVHETSGATGRTLQAWKVAATWAEMTVTWDTQPGTTGTAATAISALGWNQWDVTSLVGATGTGAPEGFLLRDAVENEATAMTHYLSSRETANPPELVITFD